MCYLNLRKEFTRLGIQVLENRVVVYHGPGRAESMPDCMRAGDPAVRFEEHEAHDVHQRTFFQFWNVGEYALQPVQTHIVYLFTRDCYVILAVLVH